MCCARCDFDSTDLWAVLPLVISLLQHEGRVTFRALRRALGCDEAFLEDLREELVFAKQVATDEEGRGLAWSAEAPVPPQLAVTATRHLVAPSAAAVTPSSPAALPPRATKTDLPPDRPITPQANGPAVSPATGLTAPPAEVSRAPDAERRQLTVMF